MTMPLSPSSTERIQRIVTLALALYLAYVWIISPAGGWWTDRWILKDGQEGTAVVTKVVWHVHWGTVYCRYRVNQTEYSVKWSSRGRVPAAIEGEKRVIYYSSSHPWLWSLSRPQTGMPLKLGVLVLLFMWYIIARLMIAAINPKSKWALGPYARQTHL